MARTATNKNNWVARLESVRAEMQRNGWLIMLFLLGMLALSAIGRREAGFLTDEILTVEPLADGSFMITQEELRMELENAFTKPTDALQLADIDLEWIEEVIERHPFVSEAEAYLDARSRLHLTATQRNPLIRIIADNGQNYLLDENGTRMPISENYIPRVLVATGNLPAWDNQFMNNEEHPLRNLFDLAMYLRADEFLDAMIEQVYLTNQSEMVLAPKVGDQTILLGRYDKEQTYERLDRLMIFYQQGLPYSGWRQYRSFDLRYNDQVVCKKR
ncbi:MAG: cell division protein FtsQ/DivIB [Bacteroidota bacterium]